MRGGTEQGLRKCQSAPQKWRTLVRSYNVPEPSLTLSHLIPTTGGGELHYYSPLREKKGIKLLPRGYRARKQRAGFTLRQLGV